MLSAFMVWKQCIETKDCLFVHGILCTCTCIQCSKADSHMKMTAFLDMVSCIFKVIERRFRGVYRPHHQGDESSS
jgi:hypothetical protein